MKTIYISSLMLTALLMLILPLCAKSPSNIPVSAAPQVEQVMQNVTIPEKTAVRVKLSESGKVQTFSLDDYIFGVVAAEMPALYEPEALKAQAVVAYTYYLRKSEGNAGKEFDITDDFTVDQAFIPPETARTRWGDGAAEYEKKIRSAVGAVLGKQVTYNGKTASTVYHALSSGKTEKAADLWGGDYPYLVAVDSSWDKLSGDYLSTKTFTFEQIKEKLSSLGDISDAGTNCFSELTRTDSGAVKTLKIGGNKVTGAEVRKALELRSADFDIAFSDGKYTFTVRGYGHGIGMSQYGAHYMAMQGKSWEEIILHYYPGCKIQ